MTASAGSSMTDKATLDVRQADLEPGHVIIIESNGEYSVLRTTLDKGSLGIGMSAISSSVKHRHEHGG